MATSAREGIRRHRKACIVIVLAAVAIAIVLTVATCSRGGNDAAETGASRVTQSSGVKPDTSITKSLVSTNLSGETDVEADDGAEPSTQNADAEAQGTGGNTGGRDSGGGTSNSGTGGEGGTGGGGSEGGQDETGGGQEESQTPEPRWVVDYEEVWVEDSAAWDEQVPLYGQREISVCNVCGADVTGNESAHAKNHFLQGEGGGHHSEVISEVIGYDTIHHEAVRHIEVREVGGHWE